MLPMLTGNHHDMDESTDKHETAQPDHTEQTAPMVLFSPYFKPSFSTVIICTCFLSWSYNIVFSF